jgi:hypothetical protein
MQRLPTGYAVSFNRQHKRHGRLFQNRYKSIICQDDAYVLGCFGKSAAKARKAYLDYVPKSRTELARELEMTVSGIGYVAERGKIVAAREGYTLIASVILIMRGVPNFR